MMVTNNAFRHGYMCLILRQAIQEVAVSEGTGKVWKSDPGLFENNIIYDTEENAFSATGITLPARHAPVSPSEPIS
jgi:hypothetical protein